MTEHRLDESERPVEYGSFISVKNLKIHVWEAGNGYPVILIHGFTGTAYDWEITPMVVRNMTADEIRIKEILKLIQSPALIIWGEQDKVIPRYSGECFHRDIRNSSLVIIPELGHMPQIEQSGIVNKAITNFITSII